MEPKNKVKFNSYNKGYLSFCSYKCSSNNIKTRKKCENTCLERYNKKNIFQSEDVKCLIKNKFINKFILLMNKQSEYLNVKLLDDIYISEHFKHNWKCLKCGFEFKQSWNEIQQGYLCLSCYPRNCGYSKEEKELSDLIKFNFKIIENSRDIISPYELDIYIPSKNIAIEFDGLYWHSDMQRKDKNYHSNKTNLCESKNIRLIHIFEDEWIYKNEIVKSKLKQILNLNSNLPKIYARKCEIKEINTKDKNKFLNKYHIQNNDNSIIKLGAFYNDELIAVMTFSHGSISKGSRLQKDIWELSRFCSNSNYHISGIASKLLSYFKKKYYWKEIFSYADRRWSDGNLYKKIGFELEHITKPNYWYIKGLNRIHRFNLRKRPYEPKDISEWILRQKEGYYRIWDCGHLKFIIRNNNNG
jgi:predicted  nucleic acid-binding Zn-ribbon protein